MNDGLMEQLLHEGESSSLDYKRDQYPFAGATDDDKSELLKDILAFANGWRHAEAYILIGVEEVAGGRSTAVGVGQHIPENDLQQFVNSKTNRPVTFSYRAYSFEGKQISVITIPQQDRPIYLNKNYGRLQKHVVYYRQGTSTAIATPDDIARMGTPHSIEKLLERQREEERRAKEEQSKEQVRATIGISTTEGLYVEVYNCGHVAVYLKEIGLTRDIGTKGLSTLALFPTISHVALDGKGTVLRQAIPHKSYDLATRKEVRFILARVPSSVIHELNQCPKESLYLSISTFGGEIHRIPGEEVKPVLEKVEELYRAMEEQEKHKITTVHFYTTDSPMRREIGTMRVHAAPKPDGSYATRIESLTPGFSLSYEEGEWLAQQVVSNHAIGRVGSYEWRIG
jgi:hypothetical protein